MTDGGVVKRSAVWLGWFALALSFSLVVGALTAAPGAAQSCVGTVASAAGRVCGLALPAPANTFRRSTTIVASPRPPAGG